MSKYSRTEGQLAEYGSEKAGELLILKQEVGCYLEIALDEFREMFGETPQQRSGMRLQGALLGIEKLVKD